MKKTSIFNELKPRTSKSAIRQREQKSMNAMEELSNLKEEKEFLRILAEEFGLKPGHPRYEKALATWRELQNEKS